MLLAALVSQKEERTVLSDAKGREVSVLNGK